MLLRHTEEKAQSQMCSRIEPVLLLNLRIMKVYYNSYKAVNKILSGSVKSSLQFRP